MQLPKALARAQRECLSPAGRKDFADGSACAWRQVVIARCERKQVTPRTGRPRLSRPAPLASKRTGEGGVLLIMLIKEQG